MDSETNSVDDFRSVYSRDSDFDDFEDARSDWSGRSRSNTYDDEFAVNFFFLRKTSSYVEILYFSFIFFF